MILLNLLLGAILWQEDFINDNLPIQQLYEYTVNIQVKDGYLHLKGNPEAEGFSCTWFFLDNGLQFTGDHIIEIYLKVNGTETRLKYFYKKQGSPVYWGQEIVVQQSTAWQKIKIPLNQAKPFYSSDFPFALTPDKNPVLYLFIDNLTRGNFDTVIDYISIIKPETIREE